MKKIFLFTLLFVFILVLSGCIKSAPINQPVACTEEAKLCPDGSAVGRVGPNCEFAPCLIVNSIISEAEARAIAEKSCIKGGEALASGTYNEITRTWWFDANLNATKPGCNPACVVDEKTKTAEINWRCTGLIEPSENDLGNKCLVAQGKWLAEFSECEDVSQDWCVTNGGQFKECESACRHDPKASVCILMCVPVCQFE